jgi:proline iminopeptidase
LRARACDLATQFEREGSAAAEFSRQLAEHDAQGSAHMSRGLQGERPSLYDFEKEIRKLTTPALIVVGDEDERCIEPGLFLKDAIPASGLAIFPKTGHAVNLEEPGLFNQVVGDFLSRADSGRWLMRDPRTRAPKRTA